MPAISYRCPYNDRRRFHFIAFLYYWVDKFAIEVRLLYSGIPQFFLRPVGSTSKVFFTRLAQKGIQLNIFQRVY